MLRIINFRKEASRTEGSNIELSDGSVHFSFKALSKYTGLNQNTINNRVVKYGFDSPLVLHKGPLSQKVFDEYGIDQSFVKNLTETKFNRSLCRRNDINCDNYSECQSSRLRVPGFPKWDKRDSTDHCYKSTLHISAMPNVSRMIASCGGIR